MSKQTDFVRDEATQARQAKTEAKLIAREIEKERVAHNLPGTELLDSKETSPANIERQLGKPLKISEFEKLIIQILPSAYFFGPYYRKVDGRAMKAVYAGIPRFWNAAGMPDDGERLISAYDADRPFIQEHSTFVVQEDTVPDLDFIHGNNLVAYDDIVTAEKRGERGPAWKKANRLDVEDRRGWRNILYGNLLASRLVSLDAIEKVVGASERKSWAKVTGKV